MQARRSRSPAAPDAEIPSARSQGPHPWKGNAVATEFRLPELGENIETGDVVRIAVTAGETIKPGQAVVELETDKAVIEVPSTVSGVIEEITVTPSARVKVGARPTL